MEEKEIEKLADQFMFSGKTVGGGDSDWIRSAFIEGYKSNTEASTLQSELEKARELLKKSIIFVDTRMHLAKEITTFLNEGKK